MMAVAAGDILQDIADELRSGHNVRVAGQGP